MKNKLIKLIPLFIAGFLSISLLPLSASAADPCEGSLPPEILAANGCDSSNSSDALPNTVRNILTGIIAAAGLVAVIYVIIGGVQYMTSTGDPSKTQKAKNTILYALIGLVICVLSFAIVNFTIDSIINNQPESSQNK